MNDFLSLNIDSNIINGLTKMNISKPTDIQIATIPSITEHKDVIGEAITGSGKTLAYLLPIIQKIPTDSKELHAIILAPTHELVVQINQVIKTVVQSSQITTSSATIVGNVNIKRQVDALKNKPNIIVGTPGRVLELIKMKKVKAHQVKTIVLDEGDKLLSDHYYGPINSIIKTTLRDRQLLLFSASVSDEILFRANEIMTDPEVIKLKNERINQDISHYCILSDRRDKMDLLRKLIHAIEPKKAIVFINRNNLIQEVVLKLNHHKIKSAGIFGNASKLDRKKELDQFRKGTANILVASDLAARGLDLENISHVINLDIPENLDEYTHRVGRTGRAGNKGIAISIVTEREIPQLMKIEKKNNISFDVKELSHGKLIDPEE